MGAGGRGPVQLTFGYAGDANVALAGSVESDRAKKHQRSRDWPGAAHRARGCAAGCDN